MSLLQINQINKSFHQHQALRNITMEVPEGSIFGLLGPNGAGKTTLIRIITRIINQDSGTISLEGEEVTAKMVRKIGYLPEERGLYKKMKVGEQLLYLAQLKGLTVQEARQRIRQWLERLELTSWYNKKVEDLSKGMAQKVQFIATVLHDPKLIILDEPFSGFDPVNADLIKDEILRLRDNGTTVIFSTHRMESVEELCDYIALINHSEKVLDGPKLEIKNSHKDGTYEVKYAGKLASNDFLSILSSEEDEFGLSISIIKDEKGMGSNELIRYIISQVDVHSFIERIPTINEIFIKNVKS